MKSLAGARLVTRIVSLRIPNRQQPPSDPKSVPLSSKALNLRMYLRSHLTMWCSRMSSASRQQHVCPHTGPWDCAIDLLPGTTLPKGLVYPLSILERKTMAEYIQEALQQGFIQPSKLALEEWHHWLEREEFPFTVITDQKNLLYLRNAKRLNPRQACWALFFTRFNFTISYRRRDHNVKANSLSRIHSPDVPTEPESILPPAIVVSPIQWDLRECICTATRTEPAPLGGPEGKTYVPASQRQTLMGSVHDLPGSGHPGS